MSWDGSGGMSWDGGVSHVEDWTVCHGMEDQMVCHTVEDWTVCQKVMDGSGLYLYHNLPILQIHKIISYYIGSTDTDTDIYSWLYQLVYVCASCASRGARGKFKMAKLEALSRQGTAVSIYPVHGSASEVNHSSVDAASRFLSPLPCLSSFC